MKRKWAYLGAALPLTMAVSTWAAAESAQDETSKMSRAKNGSWQDEEDGRSAATNESPPEKEAPGIKAPPRDAYSDDLPREHLDDDLGQTAALGSADVDVSIPDSDASMYAPLAAQGSGSLQFASADGGSVTKIVPPNGTQEGPSGTEVVPTADPEPVIEPELSDTDAMLILLGGMAEARGSNSTSSGEMVLDIVDYGPITIGYGYAKYMASGGGAHADTFVDVTGADLVFTYRADDSDSDSAYSSIYVIAIDLEEGMEEGAAAGDLNWMELLAQGPFAQLAYQEDDGDTFLEGNFSMFTLLGQGAEDEAPTGIQLATHSVEDVGSTVRAKYDSERGDLLLHAEAQGYDTLTAAEGYLVIEDHFSSVGGTLMGIA
jgi:hypothetical protein